MEALAPKDKTEKKLALKENWEQAREVECYWYKNDCTCDLCHQPITGRHMIDGRLRASHMFGLMCATCYIVYGQGFGEGDGQLYTHLKDGQWIMTFGF